MAYKVDVKIEEWIHATPDEQWDESMFLPGVNGIWKMITYVGVLGTRKMYQADHDWVFGK